MTDPLASDPALAVVVGSLEPTAELASVIELLTWLRHARPDLHALVVARTGGSWAGRVGALATVQRLDAQPLSRTARLVQRARLEPIARRVRAVAARRLLGVGPIPVVVESSGAWGEAWIDPAARPVVAHRHGSGDEGAGGDEGAATLPDLWPQGERRDDETGAVARYRATLPDAPVHLAAIAGDRDVIPGDAVLGAIWATVEAHPGTRARWLTAPLTPEARAAAEAHLRDAGLAAVVEVIDEPDDRWRTIAAADVVLAPGDDPTRVLAADRWVPVTDDPGDDADTGSTGSPTARPAPLAERVGTVLDAADPGPRPDPAALAAIAGPRWLAALGLG